MTRQSSNPVRCLDTGSSSRSFPSSKSIMIATEVIGFVIEAMPKMASDGIGTLRATSSLPAQPSYNTPPGSTTSATTPGVSPRSTAASSCRERARLPASDSLCPACFMNSGPGQSTPRALFACPGSAGRRASRTRSEGRATAQMKCRNNAQVEARCRPRSSDGHE